ncbi:MAG: exosome complex exonuclease Rrp41 [Candidatus Aenigmatarchaeota archaeon]
MMSEDEDIQLIKDGKRIDGREVDEMREMEAKAGVIERATGSGYFRLGKTEAIAAVHGPRELHPRHLQDPLKAYLRCRYNMAPFSTEDRIRPGPSRRSTEISKVITDSFKNVIFLEEFPNTGIDVFIEVLQANASTRCVSINAASIALADAGIPMKDLVSSVAVGKVEDQIVLDVVGKEDSKGEVDLPIAYVPKTDEITLLQMDGIIDKEKLMNGLKKAKEGCMKIYEKQREALKEKYTKIEG